MSTTYELQYRDAGPGLPWVRYVGGVTLGEARKIMAQEKEVDASYNKESGANITTQYRIVKVVTTVVRKVAK